MNHPQRNWRRRWAWNPATATATHESGVAVRFWKAPDASGAWQGEAASLAALDGSDHRRVARLMREAGDFAAENLNRKPDGSPPPGQP
ncbi:MAG: hypothetical protein ABI995_02710 [Acidobacteriota bacterium]